MADKAASAAKEGGPGQAYECLWSENPAPASLPGKTATKSVSVKPPQPLSLQGGQPASQPPNTPYPAAAPVSKSKEPTKMKTVAPTANAKMTAPPASAGLQSAQFPAPKTVASMPSGMPSVMKGFDPQMMMQHPDGKKAKVQMINAPANAQPNMADIQKQIALLKSQGKNPGCIVVVINEKKIRKIRKHKKHKKGSALKTAVAAGGKTFPTVDEQDSSDSDRKHAKELPAVEHANNDYDNLEPLPDGAITPDAIVAKGPGGVMMVVPIDERAIDKEKAPGAGEFQQTMKGYLRKSPDGAPVFIPEDKATDTKRENMIHGQLMHGPHGEAMFVPDGVKVDAKGKPVFEKIKGPDGKEITVVGVGKDTPVTGYVKVNKDGMPVFVQKDINNEPVNGVVVQEPTPANAVNGVLVQDKQGVVNFVKTDDVGVGATKKMQKEKEKAAAAEGKGLGPSKIQDAPGSKMQTAPVGSVIKVVGENAKGIPTEANNREEAEDKGIKPDGFVVQAPAGPVYVPKEKIEEAEKSLPPEQRQGVENFGRSQMGGAPIAAGGREEAGKEQGGEAVAEIPPPAENNNIKAKSSSGPAPRSMTIMQGPGGGPRSYAAGPVPGGGGKSAYGGAGGGAGGGGGGGGGNNGRAGAYNDPFQTEVKSGFIGGGYGYGGPGGGLQEQYATPQPVGNVAVNQVLQQSRNEQNKLQLATQVVRANEEGRTLKDVQKEDFENHMERAKARQETAEEYRKFTEARSVAYKQW